MEDELHQFSIGRFAAGSKRHRRLALLAQAHDQYETLFNQVIDGQLIDSLARVVNTKLVVENEQLVINAKFFHKEAVYYKLALEREHSIAKKFSSWALNYIITRMKGGASS